METIKEKNSFTLSDETIKNMKHSKSMKNNMNFKYHPEFNKSLNDINNINKTKRIFIAHKVDSKDKFNNFYQKGIKELFNNENLFFSEKYCNSTIKIGNSEKKSIIPESRISINKKIFVKKKTMNVYHRSLSNNRTRALFGNSRLSKLNDSNNNMSILSRYDYKRPSMNTSSLMKRPSIMFKYKDYVSDQELKMFFQNIKKKINEKNTKSRNDKFRFLVNNRDNSTNTSINNEIKNRLFLQEKILNEFKTYNLNNNNIIKKLKKITKKKKENLLMNQLENYREKMTKISQTTQNCNNHLKAIQWLSSLRKYDNNNKINISPEKKNIPMLTYTNNIKKEQILDNYINKLHYSFGSNTSLYSDIDSHIHPLYALISPQNLKNKEQTKISYFRDKNKKNFLPIIVGKNLLDYEIELSKILDGKKKIFVKQNYNDEDIKPMTFANSNNIEKIDMPKSVINALNSHFN